MPLFAWFGRLLENPERRRSQRTEAPGLVAYYWDGGVAQPHSVRDIGVDGAYLTTDTPWCAGAVIQLVIAETRGMGSGVGRNGEHYEGERQPKKSIVQRAKVLRLGPDGVAVEFLYTARKDRHEMSQFLNSVAQNGRSESSSQAKSAKAGGQSLIEFLLVLPLLFLLIVNAVNWGAFIFSWITVAHAARTGVQYFVSGGAEVGALPIVSPSQVSTLVTNDISSLLNRSSLTVTACKNNNGTVTGTGACPTADPEAPNYVLASVDVTYTYQPPLPFFNFPQLNIHTTLPRTTIHRKAVMRVLQ